MSNLEKWPPRFDPQSAPVYTRNELRTTASAESLWPILIRAADWPSWYPHAANVRIAGGGDDLDLDSVFRWKTMGITLTTRVVEFEPAKSIAWLASSPISRAFHRFDLAPAKGGGCTLVTEEVETGIGPRLLASRLKRDLHSAHQQWLEQLVAQVRT